MRERKERGLGIKARRVIAYISLIVITFFCLFWFYVLFVNATRSKGELAKGFTPIPSVHLIENWIGVINGTFPIVQGLINSALIATLSGLLGVYFSTMTAYALHAYNFKFRKAIFTYILMIMMIPSQVTALGFYRLLLDMKLTNSFIPLIIPSIAAPVTFYYMKQFMESNLPLSLVEAARIDGSGEFNTFNKVVLPLMKPALAVQMIFAFVGSWNNYFIPALILSDPKKKTLPIIIAELRSADWAKFDMGQVYVMIAFSILPVIVVYIFLSRFIVGGVAAGSVKG